jgi:hypothetical protein
MCAISTELSVPPEEFYKGSIPLEPYNKLVRELPITSNIFARGLPNQHAKGQPFTEY